MILPIIIIIIRYNPDKIKNNNNKIQINQDKRLEKLKEIIIKELSKNYNKLKVKLIQLYYDNDIEPYNEYKECDITKMIAI
jgi:hypothetical protein